MVTALVTALTGTLNGIDRRCDRSSHFRLVAVDRSSICRRCGRGRRGRRHRGLTYRTHFADLIHTGHSAYLTTGHARHDVIEQVPQGGEIIERHRSIGFESIFLTDFAHHLRFADAVDPQIGLQVHIQLDDLFRVTGLLDNKVDQERFDIRSHCTLVDTLFGTLTGGGRR